MNKVTIIMSIFYVLFSVGMGSTQEVTKEPFHNLDGFDADLWETVVELSNSSDCILPCWWGFELGKTSIDDVLDFLERTGLNRSQQRSPYPDISQESYIQDGIYWLDLVDVFNNNNDVGELRYNFAFTEEGILRLIHIVLTSPSAWLTDEENPLDISKILNEFEDDPEMFTSISPSLYPYELPLWFIYPEYNLMLGYELRFTYPLVCIDVDHLLWINLEVPSNETVDDFESAEYMVPINEQWQFEHISTEEFIEFFRDKPDECLDISEYTTEEK